MRFSHRSLNESTPGDARLPESGGNRIVRPCRQRARSIQRRDNALRLVARGASQHALAEPHDAQRVANRGRSRLCGRLPCSDRTDRDDRSISGEQFGRPFGHAQARRVGIILIARTHANAARIPRAIPEREVAPDAAASSGRSRRGGLRRRHRRAASREQRHADQPPVGESRGGARRRTGLSGATPRARRAGIAGVT